jgi:ABC-2 type transport system ATP-binding protein
VINLDRVTKRYGGKTAVGDLTLNVESGEVFAFLGPNGAGKTTTIKLLVGLLSPDEGTIHIGPYDVVLQPRAASRWVGYIPDQPYLYEKLTGREFLDFMAGMYGMSPADGAASIDKQVGTFGLETFVDRLSETYSHGMKQRLVFAAAMVHQPRVLILDEPMVGLDPHSMRQVKDLLRARSREGVTVFMSTHTLSLAEEIADRIGVIDQGTLRFLGTVDELKRRSRCCDNSLEELFLQLTTAETPLATAKQEPSE